MIIFTFPVRSQRQYSLSNVIATIISSLTFLSSIIVKHCYYVHDCNIIVTDTDSTRNVHLRHSLKCWPDLPSVRSAVISAHYGRYRGVENRTRSFHKVNAFLMAHVRMRKSRDPTLSFIKGIRLIHDFAEMWGGRDLTWCSIKSTCLIHTLCENAMGSLFDMVCSHDPSHWHWSSLKWFSFPLPYRLPSMWRLTMKNTNMTVCTTGLSTCY